jgi:tetratricopeptide (TPR) repeat protein
LRPTLARLDAPARTVLQIASLLAPDGVALPWVRTIAGQSHTKLAMSAATGENDPWTQLIRSLIGMRLFQPTSEPRVVTMHRLLKRVLESELLEDVVEKEQLLRKVINQARDRCQFLHDDGWVSPMNRWELEPLIACSVQWIARDITDGAYISHEIATVFQKLGDERTAERLYEAARAKVKASHILSELDPNHAALLNNQAKMLEDRGENEKAMEMYKQALAIYRLNFGNNHQFVATACVNLAKSCVLADRIDEAETLISEAVAIDEHLYGADHPELVADLTVYAAILQQRGELEMAEKKMVRIIEICRKNLPQNHPHIAIGLSNLATLKLHQHKPQEAEPLLREAVAINRNCLGSEHPDLATRLNNLAMVLRASGKLKEAIELSQEALTILVAHSKETGHPHANIQAAVNTLGGIAMESGLPDPIVHHVINGILSPLQTQRHYEKPIQENVATTPREFGAKSSPAHPAESVPLNQATSREQLNLAVAHEVKGNFAEAAVWYRKAAEQGIPHAQFNLGVFLLNGIGCKQNEAEAVKWFQAAANQGYVNAIYNLAFMYENGSGCQRDLKLAFELYQSAAKEKEPDSQYKVATLLLDQKLQVQAGLDYRQQSQGALIRSGKRFKVLLKATFGKLTKSNPIPRSAAASQPSSWAFVKSDNQTANKLLRDAASRGHAQSLELLQKLGWS